jgi:hypothetical protein
MSYIFLFGLLILNFGISWWNAWVTGRVWRETKAMGGLMRLVAWAGAIQSAAGFTLVISVVLAAIAFSFHLLNNAAFAAVMNLTYLLIIVPILGSGIVITIQSWIVAYRERSWGNMGVAAWNTFAMAENTYDALDGGISGAFNGIKSFFGSDDDEDAPMHMLVIMIVLAALGSGCLLTYVIMRRAMGTLTAPAAVQSYR